MIRDTTPHSPGQTMCSSQEPIRKWQLWCIIEIKASPLINLDLNMHCTCANWAWTNGEQPVSDDVILTIDPKYKHWLLRLYKAWPQSNPTWTHCISSPMYLNSPTQGKSTLLLLTCIFNSQVFSKHSTQLKYSAQVLYINSNGITCIALY